MKKVYNKKRLFGAFDLHSNNNLITPETQLIRFQGNGVLFAGFEI